MFIIFFYLKILNFNSLIYVRLIILNKSWLCSSYFSFIITKFYFICNNGKCDFRNFVSIPLEVLNMSDTSTTEYIMESNNSSIYDSDSMKEVMSNIK